jgi:hypothetical protein
MLSKGCRWWPFLGLLIWIVPAVLGFGFGCDKDEPDVPDTPPTTEVLSNPDLQTSSADDAGLRVPGWVFVPIFGGIGAAFALFRRDS